MTSVYLLRIGKGKHPLYLDSIPFGPTSFSLTENIEQACLLALDEAERVVAQYRVRGVDFVVEEYSA